MTGLFLVQQPFVLGPARVDVVDRQDRVRRWRSPSTTTSLVGAGTDAFPALVAWHRLEVDLVDARRTMG